MAVNKDAIRSLARGMRRGILPTMVAPWVSALRSWSRAYSDLPEEGLADSSCFCEIFKRGLGCVSKALRTRLKAFWIGSRGVVDLHEDTGKGR